MTSSRRSARPCASARVAACLGLALTGAAGATTRAQAPTAVTPPAATITCPDRVQAGDLFTCRVSVAMPRGVRDAVVRLTLPPAIFFVEAAHTTLDANNREVTLPVTGATGGLVHDVRLLAENGVSGGATLTVTLTPPDSHTPLDDERSAHVELARVRDVDLGFRRLAVHPGLVFLALVLSIPMVLMAIRILRRGRRAAVRRPGYPPMSRDGVMLPATFMMVGLVFSLMGLPSTIESIRSHTSFVATTCRVLDREMSGEHLTTPVAIGNEGPSGPMAALRYDTAAGPRIAAGFDVMGTAQGAGGEDDYKAFDTGRPYPCWYDPANPARVVLRRGPSGLALLTILPLALFVAAFRSTVHAWRW
jgi:hypothetical protein